MKLAFHFVLGWCALLAVAGEAQALVAFITL